MKGQKLYVTGMVKLVAAYALFTGIIASVFLYFFVYRQQTFDTSPRPTPLITQTINPSLTPVPTLKTEGKFCGGIAGRQCPQGYFCKLAGNYPDAGGTCIKK